MSEIGTKRKDEKYVMRIKEEILQMKDYTEERKDKNGKESIESVDEKSMAERL